MPGEFEKMEKEEQAKLIGLFLDDNRNPINIEWVAYDYTPITWEIVRNYDQFVKAILEKEYDIISMDHDLDICATMECIRISETKEKFNYQKLKHKTGKHCAEFLKEHYTSKNKDLPNYLVHSLNPQGRENIIQILGKEKLVATHSLEITFERADEILEKRKRIFK